jgi:hypothetical protein
MDVTLASLFAGLPRSHVLANQGSLTPIKKALMMKIQAHGDFFMALKAGGNPPDGYSTAG